MGISIRGNSKNADVDVFHFSPSLLCPSQIRESLVYMLPFSGKAGMGDRQYCSRMVEMSDDLSNHCFTYSLVTLKK